jgi:hypothetical protein
MLLWVWQYGACRRGLSRHFWGARGGVVHSAHVSNPRGVLSFAEFKRRALKFGSYRGRTQFLILSLTLGLGNGLSPTSTVPEENYLEEHHVRK